MRAIVFDLDGTLLHLPRGYEAVLRDALESELGEVRPEWTETYGERFAEAFRDLEPEPYRRAFAALEGVSDPDPLVAALRDREAETSRPSAGAEDALERLSADVRIGVLTNGVRAWQAHKLRANGLDRYVDAMVASYEAGAHKPDPAPFRLLEDRLPADGYVMIGDDDADVEGAERAGWRARRYDGDGFDDLPGAIEW